MSTLSAIRERARIFDALRYRDYRLFWFGQLFSVLGFQMMLVTQLWLVYDLTGSKLQLGLVGYPRPSRPSCSTCSAGLWLTKWTSAN